ncbi:MAG TPA: ATPase [Bdellovibrionales bacterium]|nr:ATPase [Pseudobdellovibrionaceae bacterium]HAG90635.1 ATPase [Bdellovibrionales bacterium]
MSLVELLENSKVIVSAGTGGVGKTTVSAALGVTLARRGKKVLVLTIDPAKRLIQALGLEGSAYEAIEVQGIEGLGQLKASMIDAKSIFDRFVEKFAPNSEVVERLKDNRLYQQLVTALTGSQEFTSMDRLLSEFESGEYDIIVLDTPPTQNAVDFLKAPQRIVQLFDERITKWFAQGTQKKGHLLSKIISRGTHTALAALEKVTGAEFIGELSDFFEQMSFLQKSVRERSQKVQALLAESHTTFVVVASPDSEKLTEATQFVQSLKDKGFHFRALLLNRAYPEWYQSGEKIEADNEFFKSAHTYYDQQFQKLKKFKDNHGSMSIFSLPESDEPLIGLKDIVKLSKVVEEL